MYYSYEPKATFEQILNMIVKQNGMDDDGLFYPDWLERLKHGDLLAELMKQIILRKDDPTINPLFQEITIEIEGILDREYDDV